MIKYFVLAPLLLLTISISAQIDKSQRKSPPVVNTYYINGSEARLDYSSPKVRGRQLYGGLVPYGKIWRTGANEASKIKLSHDFRINGELLPQGEYSIFTIPNDKSWIIIFNKVADQWGHYNYNSSEDALRVTVQSEHSDHYEESMILKIKDQELIYAWGSLTWSVSMIPQLEVTSE